MIAGNCEAEPEAQLLCCLRVKSANSNQSGESDPHRELSTDQRARTCKGELGQALEDKVGGSIPQQQQQPPAQWLSFFGQIKNSAMSKKRESNVVVVWRKSS